MGTSIGVRTLQGKLKRWLVTARTQAAAIRASQDFCGCGMFCSKPKRVGNEYQVIVTLVES